MEPKGEYNSSTYYEKLNTVTYNDSTYMAKESVQGENPTTSSKWQLIGGGVTKEYVASQIVDNLNSTDSTKILSAKQGKVLNDKIDDVNAIKPSMYDTVALMKADTDLIDGDYAQTLGYYSANDGGGATYKITAVESETDYQEEISNDLYATLIVDNNVNVKQFGAKGDGVTDDTESFTKAISYLFNKIVNTGSYNVDSVLYINGGQYVINETLEIPTLIKIRALSPVTLISNVIGTLIKLYAPSNVPNFTDNSYIFNNLIDGINGLKLINNLNSKTGTTGIEIANELPARNKFTSGYNLAHIDITNFENGILVHTKDNYINGYTRIAFNNNTNGIVLGELGETQNNSGENFVFDRCCFTGGVNNVLYNVGGMDCNFNNCSFDYGDNVFVDSDKGYRKMYISGGHIEAIDNYVLKGGMRNSTIVFEGVRMMLNQNCNFADNIGTSARLILSNNSIIFMQLTDGLPGNEYLINSENVIPAFINNFYAGENNGKPYHKKLLLNKDAFFENVTVESITPSNNLPVGKYKIDGLQNVGNTEIIEDTSFASNGRAIKFAKSDTSASAYLSIRTDYISCKPGQLLMCFVAGKNSIGSTGLYAYFYDKDGNETFTNNYIYNIGETNTKKVSSHCIQIIAPSGCCYVRFGYRFYAQSNDDNIINGILPCYIN